MLGDMRDTLCSSQPYAGPDPKNPEYSAESAGRQRRTELVHMQALLRLAASRKYSIVHTLYADSEQAASDRLKSLQPPGARWKKPVWGATIVSVAHVVSLSEEQLGALLKKPCFVVVYHKHSVEEIAGEMVSNAGPFQEQLCRIICCAQQTGHTVLTTGQGAGDIGMLKAADVGVAMGIAGSEGAKRVSDAILRDDDICTLVNAVEFAANAGCSPGILDCCASGGSNAPYYQVGKRPS